MIKLGGSLLTMPNLKEKFHRWCAANPHPLTLIIVGGGEVVDAIREVHRSNSLDESFAHWLCIDLLKHTARLAHHIIGDVELYETRDDLQQPFSGSKKNSKTPIIAIVQVGTCFARDFPHLGLPNRWDVTSDSLAAAFCQMYAADELVMMKSSNPASGVEDSLRLADTGFVDPHFEDLAEEIEKVRFVNLRTY